MRFLTVVGRAERGVAGIRGTLPESSAAAGGRRINGDRMWHYTQGVGNGNPLRCGFDSLDTLGHLMATGYEHSWFILNTCIIAQELALPGSEQNPDLTGTDVRAGWAPEPGLDAAAITRMLVERYREVGNAFGKDGQPTAIASARRYLGDKLIRMLKPHRTPGPGRG